MKLPTMRRVQTTAGGVQSATRVPSDEAPTDEFATSTSDLVQALVIDNSDFVFRNLRRAGLDTATAEDCLQQVFLIAARKLDLIVPGKERAFLYAIAMNVAADFRRKISRRGEMELSDAQLDALESGPSSSPDHVLEQRRARELLDEVLSAMPEELREVFVLSELEEMSKSAVAACLEIPSGTVASRLSRARQLFDESVARIKARRTFRSGA